MFKPSSFDKSRLSLLFNSVNTIYPYRHIPKHSYEPDMFTIQKHTTFRKKDKTVLLEFKRISNSVSLIYKGKKYGNNEKVSQVDVLSKQKQGLFYIPFIIDKTDIIKPVKNIWNIIQQLHPKLKNVTNINDTLDLLYSRHYLTKMFRYEFTYPKILFRDEDKKSYRVHFDVRFPLNNKLFSFVIAKYPPNAKKRRLGVLRMPDHPKDYQFFQGIVFQDYGYGQVELADIGKIKYEKIEGSFEKLSKLDIKLDGQIMLNGNYTLVKDKNKKILWYFIYRKNNPERRGQFYGQEV